MRALPNSIAAITLFYLLQFAALPGVGLDAGARR